MTASMLAASGSFPERFLTGLTEFVDKLSPAFIFLPVALAICVIFFIYYWHCLRPRPHSLEWISMSEARLRRSPMTLTLKRHPFQRKDWLPMLLITVVYAATAFSVWAAPRCPRATPSSRRTAPSPSPTISL